MRKIFTSISILVIMVVSIWYFYCKAEAWASAELDLANSTMLKNNRSQVTLFTNELSYDEKTGTCKSGEVLLNPGKGFVLRNSVNNDYDNLVNIGYYRFYWKDIEPEEGKYNWDVIDSKIEDYAKRGKKFSFGVSCASSSVNGVYVTPKWVFDDGADYYEAKISSKLTQIIPVWTDGIFLQKLNKFVEALGERYDGNENIAYIDIRSYGNYGEQHLNTIGGDYITNDELIELYIKPYREAFSKTLLVNPYAIKRYEDANKWAVDNGITLRKDSIMVWSNGADCKELAYNKLPVIWEYGYKYKLMKEYRDSKGNPYWNEEKLLSQMDKGSPSYMEFYPEMYEDNARFCEYVANKMGYYFEFKQAEYTYSIKTTENNDMSLTFINEGVAPLYETCTVYIGLLDQNHNLVKKYKTDIDPHTWMPDEEKTENISLQLNGVESGEYTIAVGLFYNEYDENPTYLLGNIEKTEDKWYIFGKINITYPEEEFITKDEKPQTITGIKEDELYTDKNTTMIEEKNTIEKESECTEENEETTDEETINIEEKNINNIKTNDTRIIDQVNTSQITNLKTQPSILPRTGTYRTAVIVLFAGVLAIAFLIRYKLIKIK